MSCASADKPRIAPILHALLAQGFELWIDNPYDQRLARHPGVHTLRPGNDWQRTLNTALEAAAGVLMFWSAHSVQPERRLLHEEAAAGLQQAALIQVAIDDVLPGPPFRARHIHRLAGLVEQLSVASDPTAAALSDAAFQQLVDDIDRVVDTAAANAIGRAIEVGSRAGEPRPGAGAGPTAEAVTAQSPALDVDEADFHVFLNYRRRDCGWPAISLHGRLVEAFGKDSVFLDVASLEPGDDYEQRIEDKVVRSNVFLALIGTQWLDARDAKNAFGKLIDIARAEPVAIEKHGRPVVVVLSLESYEQLRSLDPTQANRTTTHPNRLSVGRQSGKSSKQAGKR